MGNNKLELTWIGKDNQPQLEPRILIEDPSKSYGDKNTQNMLIHGDNLLALKALEQDYAGKIKCIYIDPPYNINVANPHYNDDKPNSDWLSLMNARLHIIYKLLHEDGLLAVQIDDEQFARLYLLISEVFGGDRNLKTIVVKMSESSGLKMGAVKRSGIIPKLKEYIILAKKNGVKNLKPIYIRKDKWDDEYNNFVENFSREDRDYIDSISEKDDISDEDINKVDKILSNIKAKSISYIKKDLNINSEEDRSNWLFENSWRIFRTTASTSVFNLVEEKKKYCNQIYFAVKSKKDGLLYIAKSDYSTLSKQPRVQILFSDNNLMTNLGDLWMDIKTTGLDAEGNVSFKNSKKPEFLINRILYISTKEGDIVLDSFLGSGTTAAVAHKMNRKWIGIELGDHCDTHCLPRLKQVVDGTDQGGISKSVNWNGGGGFKYYDLAPSLLKQDKYGNWIIDSRYNADMLASAMAKHEGFKYQPDTNCYWKQGIKYNENKK